MSIIFHKNDSKKDFKDDDYFCVFDRNGNTNKQLNDAIQLARLNNIHIVFSNPCFEYWVLCHFESCPKSMEFDGLKKRLDKHFGKYRKNDKDIYNKTMNRLDDALKNARDINHKHRKSRTKLISRDSNPSTLMIELIQHLKTKIRH